jgi:hypothetical protein
MVEAPLVATPQVAVLDLVGQELERVEAVKQR